MLNEDIYDDQDPMLQAVDIHRARIMEVINKLIEKIELCVCMDDILPSLESEKSYNLFSKKSIAQINRLLSIQRNRSTRFKTSSSFSTRSKRGTLTFYSSIMSQDRDMVAFNTNVIAKMHHSGVMTKSMRDNYIRNLPPTTKTFILSMYKLKKHIFAMVKNTETEETRSRKLVSETWFRNLDTKEKLINYENIHTNKIKDTMETITDKKSTIKNLKDQINTLHEKKMSVCENIVLNSENKMKRTLHESDESQNKLLNEANALTRDYLALLTKNLANEKKVRTKRYKVETVLAQWLASYDSDIGDLQKELEEVQDGYNEIKGKYDQLKADFETQTVQYNEVMEEKEAEERRLFEIKLYRIIATRSARIIQRWWKKIYAKRHKKRKGKGKGKGKKGKGKKK